MSIDLIKKVYDLIATDPEITINLARWDFGSGNEPAIFTIDPPNECAFPQITMYQEQGNSEMINRANILTTVPVSVKVWGNKSGSQKGLLAVANLVYEKLNDCVLSLASGYQFKSATADPPALVDDEDGFPGYEIVCNVEYVE